MSDYTVSIEEATNTVSVTDVINSVSVSETDGNSVTVVAATFVNDAGAASSLFYSNGVPSDATGSEGDFYVDVSNGKLYGPKGASSWEAEALPLIPKRYTHTQSVASSSWTISHTLDGYPSVTVVDSAGTVVIGKVTYNSTSSVTVDFQGSFTGLAYLT